LVATEPTDTTLGSAAGQLIPVPPSFPLGEVKITPASASRLNSSLTVPLVCGEKCRPAPNEKLTIEMLYVVRLVSIH
jgi:hypothetical protein